MRTDGYTEHEAGRILAAAWAYRRALGALAVSNENAWIDQVTAMGAARTRLLQLAHDPGAPAWEIETTSDGNTRKD